MRNISYLFLVILVFIYGIAIGRYQVFPYQELRKVQNMITGPDTENKIPSNLNTVNLDIIDTALQRLLVKELTIDVDYSPELYRTGGAITSLDGLIYINTNRNDEKKEDLVVFDTRTFERIEIEGLSVPMNYNDFLNYLLLDAEKEPLYLFRVTGMYVEKTGINEHTLFVTHNEFHPDSSCVTFSVSRVSIQFDHSKVEISQNWDTIFRSLLCVDIKEKEDKNDYLTSWGRMSGGSIISYDNNRLLISTGNFHRADAEDVSLAMDISSVFGKLILLNKQTGEHSIFAMGLRNPQGLLMDDYNNIWATDHGPQGGDELNLIEKGDNYGWPMVTYGIEYGNKPWPLNKKQGRHEIYTKPVFAWVPSIGISKIIRLDKFNKFQLWSDDLIVGSMIDKSLHRIRLNEDKQVIYNERITIDHRIRDFTKLEDESIALLADAGILVIVDDGGLIYETIGPEVEERIIALGRYDQFLDNPQKDFSSQLATAETIFIQNCSSCHSLQEKNGVGPHLNNFFSRSVGGISDFNYSSALSSRDEAWTPELMKDFLLQKEPFANTLMQKVDLTETEIDSIIHYLRTTN